MKSLAPRALNDLPSCVSALSQPPLVLSYIPDIGSVNSLNKIQRNDATTAVGNVDETHVIALGFVLNLSSILPTKSSY